MQEDDIPEEVPYEGHSPLARARRWPSRRLWALTSRRRRHPPRWHRRRTPPPPRQSASRGSRASPRAGRATVSPTRAARCHHNDTAPKVSLVQICAANSAALGGGVLPPPAARAARSGATPRGAPHGARHEHTAARRRRERVRLHAVDRQRVARRRGALPHAAQVLRALPRSVRRWHAGDASGASGASGAGGSVAAPAARGA